MRRAIRSIMAWFVGFALIFSFSVLINGLMWLLPDSGTRPEVITSQDMIIRILLTSTAWGMVGGIVTTILGAVTEEQR